MADFYAARDNTMPPLPWTSIAPPFSLADASQLEDLMDIDGYKALIG